MGERFTRRGATMRRAVSGALAAAALLALAPALALADQEPNDGITQFEGPVRGGTANVGELSTPNDSDWYVAYIAPQTQLDLAVSVPQGGGCTSIVGYLRDGDGHRIDSVSGSRTTVGHIRYTTPGGDARRYFISFARSYGCSSSAAKYQFALEPAAAVLDGPPKVAASPTAEPNEFAGQAIGPLTGGVPYAAKIDTSNDQEWFYFFSSGTTPIDVAMANVGSCRVYARVNRDGDTRDGESADVSSGEIGHIRYTPLGRAKYLLQIGGCEGASFEFRIDPATSITSTPPPPPAPPPAPAPAPPPPAPAPIVPAVDQCARAKVSVATWKKRLKRAQKAAKRTRSRRKRSALKKTVRQTSRSLTQATRRVGKYC